MNVLTKLIDCLLPEVKLRKYTRARRYTQVKTEKERGREVRGRGPEDTNHGKGCHFKTAFTRSLMSLRVQ